MKTLIYALLITSLWSLSACNGPTKLSGKSLSLYAVDFHPVYRLQHDSSETKLHIHSQSPDYTIVVRAYETEQIKTLLYENHYNFKAGNNSFSIPLKLSYYFLELTITDLQSGYQVIDILKVDKSRYSSQHIHLENMEGQPILQKHYPINEAIRAEHSKFDTLYIKYFSEGYRPAPSPKSSRGLKFNPFDNFDEVFPIKTGKSFTLDRRGLYFIQADTSKQQGIFLSCFKENYPRIDEVDELISSTRYITKNEEYQQLLKAENKKEALDDFWLERGGSRDRSRVLISAYYNRVQEANRFFTDYKEGWKTDRGIIYTIFGPADKIRKFDSYEFWYYAARADRPAVQFHFDKVNEHYLLRRSTGLELPWNAEIYRWRRGTL